MSWDILRPENTLDEWQKQYIEEEGNCLLLCGRQSGKSTACSIKIVEKAVKEKSPCDYLVVALTEKQAYNLFLKALSYLERKYPNMVKRGKEKPTMHEINLKNGVCIMCHACGATGDGLRTYTLKRIFVDEASPMDRRIFTAITPMLSVTGGSLDLLSTPRGKEGFFYECSQSDNFRKFYVSAEDCPRHDKKFLEQEKKRMSKLEYAQEYLAVFLDDLKRLYSDELIKKVCVLKRPNGIKKDKNYLGSDIAGLGSDETTYEIVRKINDENLIQVENIIEKKNYTTDTTNRIIELNNIYDFRLIGVDDGGAGFGVFSELLREDKTKTKVRALNNSTRPLDREGKKNKKLLKEEMYLNLLSLMEHGFIKLLDDDEIIASLKSIQFEYEIKEGRNTDLRIFGNYSHIVEGIIRAVWLISENKSRELWCEYT
jgi:hypothetical protein